MYKIKRNWLPLAGGLLILSCLGACSSSEAPTAAEKGASVAPADGAGTSKGSKILKEDAQTSISQIGETTYDPNTDMAKVRLRISNFGKVPLPAEGGEFPVRVGIVLLGPDGTSNPPGTRDFSRLNLPSAIEPGKNAEVDAVFPVAPTLGMKIQFELLQENVAWFTFEYGQPPLVVGPFERCTGDAKSLCSGGQTVAAQSVEQAAPAQ